MFNKITYTEVFSSDDEHDFKQEVNQLTTIKCSFINNGIKPSKERFYICSCNPSKKNLICEECFKYCHLGPNHNQLNAIVVSGICNCGVTQHKVKTKTEENKVELIKECIFNDLNSISGNKIIYLFKRKDSGEIHTSLCAFCLNFCYNNQIQKANKRKNESQQIDNNENASQENISEENSIIKLNITENKKYKERLQRNKQNNTSINGPNEDNFSLNKLIFENYIKDANNNIINIKERSVDNEYNDINIDKTSPRSRSIKNKSSKTFISYM